MTQTVKEKRALAEVEQRYLSYMSQHTSKVSQIVRMVTLGILALTMWRGLTIPILLKLVIVCDVLQYLYASVVWSHTCFLINNYPNYRAKWWSNFGTNFFFYAKATLFICLILFWY